MQAITPKKSQHATLSTPSIPSKATISPLKKSLRHVIVIHKPLDADYVN
jgi:hypothetical protein